MTALTPFRVDVPAPVLDELAVRLRRRRSLDPPVLDGGERREVLEHIEALLAYWRDGFDWHRQQQRLNAFPQFRAVVDGVALHLLHVRGTGPDPVPLLLTNGWPSSFVEYLQVIGPLTDPARHGGDPATSFDVVVPALPGYGFSDHCRDRRLTRLSAAQLFHGLMTDVLGYRHYVVHGDDIGGGVANRLGMTHADAVLAVQSANWVTPDLAPDDPSLTAAERRYLARSTDWDDRHGAYAHVQRTRPHTLAAALDDSPAGLAYWVLEKWLTWSDPATRPRLSDDDLLTTVTLYWVTQTIASSMRLYALPPVAPTDVLPPAYVVVPKEPDLPDPPDEILRRLYHDLRRVDRVTAGGHFLALEAPHTLVHLIRSNLHRHCRAVSAPR